MGRVILAIDPGNIDSGYALVEMPEFKLLDFGKADNNELLNRLWQYRYDGWPKCDGNIEIDAFVIEMVACYGMPVGKDIFDTCVWIGRFTEALHRAFIQANYIYRKDEKIALCGSLKAKDSNIKQALINRYAKFDFKRGKGLKNNPDTFYGVSNDVWQAIAVGVTYYEEEKE